MKKKCLSITEIHPNGERKRRLLNAGDTLEMVWLISVHHNGQLRHEVRLGTVTVTARPDRESDLSIYFEADKAIISRVCREYANKVEKGEG